MAHSSLRLIVAITLSGLLSIPVAGQVLAPPAGAADPASVVEQEVRTNILNQPVGPARVADLGLSEAFIQRFADRVIRSSFENRYRIVVADAPPAGTPGASPGSTPGSAPGTLPQSTQPPPGTRGTAAPLPAPLTPANSTPATSTGLARGMPGFVVLVVGVAAVITAAAVIVRRRQAREAGR